MTNDRARRLSGVFDELETRTLKNAYVLAVHSLALTHTVDERVKTSLADLILKIYTTESLSASLRADVGKLAARCVERYITFYNLCRVDGSETLH